MDRNTPTVKKFIKALKSLHRSFEIKVNFHYFSDGIEREQCYLTEDLTHKIAYLNFNIDQTSAPTYHFSPTMTEKEKELEAGDISLGSLPKDLRDFIKKKEKLKENEDD